MPIIDTEHIPSATHRADRETVAGDSAGSDESHAEKPTKALIGIALLVAIGIGMYGLGTKQPGSDQPSQVMARSNIQH